MIRLTTKLEEAQFVTHAGNFHADDVLATVFLEKLNDDITVIRLLNYQDDGKKLAYDIGGGKYDHHQKEYKRRKEGFHYCSFGLLWQSFGREYLKKIKVCDIEMAFQIFDDLFVKQIDAVDNGEFQVNSTFNVYLIDNLIALFRPKYELDEDENKCFLEAVSFATTIFDKALSDVLSKVAVINKIKKLIPTIKDKVLVLDEFIPYEYSLFYLNLDVNFVVFPSNRGGYAAHTVASVYKGFDSKVPFKKEWGGLRDEELQKITGVKTARFCHNNLFLATADTKEDALKLVFLCNKKDAKSIS